MNCPNCKNAPFSIFDRAYLKVHGTCWDCDKDAWAKGEHALEWLEDREATAYKELNKK